MGGMSLWHWIIVLVVVVVLFGGRGKLSSIMGDAAKGIRAFQKGLKGDEDTSTGERPGTLPRTDAEKEDLKH